MYPDAADLVAASTVSELTSLEEAQQDGLRDEAILAVEGVCKQSFTLEGGSGSGSGDDGSVTRAIDGTGGDVLYLPKRLVELTGLEVAGGVIATGDVVLSEKRDRLHLPDPRSGMNWLTQAYAEMTGAEHRAFPTGPGAVSVTGTWGWADEEVPPPIATALRYDMEDRALANAHALADTVRSAKSLGVSALQQGGLSMSLGGREAAVSTRVRRVLANADLIWHGPVGALA